MDQNLQELGREAERILADQAAHQPYRLVLAAVGVGVVLGGGIPRWALRLGVSAGVRMLMTNALADLAGD